VLPSPLCGLVRINIPLLAWPKYLSAALGLIIDPSEELGQHRAPARRMKR